MIETSLPLSNPHASVVFSSHFGVIGREVQPKIIPAIVHSDQLKTSLTVIAGSCQSVPRQLIIPTCKVKVVIWKML